MDPAWEVVIIVHEGSAAYAALLTPSGMCAVMARQRRKRSQGRYLPIWWHKERDPTKERVCAKQPGKGWRLYIVHPSRKWQITHKLGKILGPDFTIKLTVSHRIAQAIEEAVSLWRHEETERIRSFGEST